MAQIASVSECRPVGDFSRTGITPTGPTKERVKVGKRVPIPTLRRLASFPPSPPRWDDNCPATPQRPRHVSTEPVSVGRQLSRYTSTHTTRFHRARLGGTTTVPLHSQRPRHVSTEPASVGRQLSRYTSTPTTRFHRARLGGTTLPLHLNARQFPPSPPRWADNCPAANVTNVSGARSVGRQNPCKCPR